MKRLGLSGLALATGLTLFGCGREKQEQLYLNSKPVVQEINRDSITAEVKKVMQYYAVKKGDTWRRIRAEFYPIYEYSSKIHEILPNGHIHDQGIYSPINRNTEAEAALQDTNFALDRCGYIQTLVEVPDFSSWNGINYTPVKFRGLRFKDTLFLPEILISPHGEEYFFEPSGLEDSIDNRICVIQK